MIVVIGAGVAGLEAALALARHGIESLLVERSARAGGRAATYSCKALEEECQACGACLAGQKLAEVLECPLVRLRLHTEVQSAERAEGGFRVRLRQGDSQEEVLAQGVIVTVGFTPVFPARRGEFGYGHLAGVITALEAEAILQDTPEAFAPGAQVAFVQCAGSRDPAAGIPYCSRACCLYVPKLARLLAAVSGAQADVYFMDRQSYPPVYRDGNQGLRYLRGMPSRVFPLADGRLEIRCAGPGGDQPRPRAYDWVVLCPAMTPAAGGAELGRWLGLGTDARGFLLPRADSGAPAMAAGACTGPVTILESVASARAAAAEMACRLAPGSPSRPHRASSPRHSGPDPQFRLDAGPGEC